MLLRLCREDASHLWTRLNNMAGGEFTWFMRLREWALGFFKEVDDTELDERERNTLVDKLRWEFVYHPPSLVARAVVEGLDGALGARFSSLFRHRGAFAPGPGEAFPVLALPLLPEYRMQGTLGINPESLERPVDQTAHLGLMPQHSSFKVTFSWQLDDMLAGLGIDSKIGLALPNSRIDLDHSVSELRWERYTREGRALFRNVLPTDEQEQRRRLLSLVDRALAEGVRLLVFPELSVPHSLLADLETHLSQTRPADRPVIIAGSSHVEDEHGRWRNRATLLLPGSTRLTHDKFEPFSFMDWQDDGSPAPMAERLEDIHRERSLCVYICGRWSFVVLICKDFMTRSIITLLEQLRPRLVLVPALSPKTEPFETHARMLGLHTQAIVLVANAAGEGSPQAQSVLAWLPLRGDSCSSLHRSEVSPPCLVLVRLRDGKLILLKTR